MKHQMGVGLVEVLVALLLLAVGVLGFSVLQFRAMEAAQEATERTVAINTARDLAERMRINRLGLENYKTAINNANEPVDPDEPPEDPADCFGKATTYTPSCTSAQIAEYDANQIITKAAQAGHTIIVADCVASSLNCIYTSWGDTEITADDVSQCVDETTGTYIVDSKCQVMEAF